jgi:hypothetical protein
MITVPPRLPELSVNVKGMLAVVPPENADVGTVALNVPEPGVEPIVSVTGPENVIEPDAEILSVTLMLTVALEVAACAAAQNNSAVRIRNIFASAVGALALEPPSQPKAFRAPHKV